MGEKRRLGDLLVDAGAIDAAQLETALSQQRQLGRPLGMTLLRLGFLDEDTLIRTLASQLDLPIVKLAGKRVNEEVLDLVPSDLAEKFRCIPLVLNTEGGGRVLYLGMEDPADQEAVAEIGFRTGEEVKPVLVAPQELEEALHRHYHWASYGVSTPLATDASVSESSFGEMEPVAGTVADKPAAAADGRDEEAGVAPPAILRALVQLLVEKGVVSREELIERVGQVVDGGDTGF